MLENLTVKYFVRKELKVTGKTVKEKHSFY